MSKSDMLFARAVDKIPGGVNSPVRAFQNIGRNPIFMKKGKGSILTDVDGKEYVDFIGSWGPMILGHQHPEVMEAVYKACENGLSFGMATEIEVEMAELMCEIVPGMEMVRMVNSGTEAVMSAIRVARGFTGKNKIIKFTGCYHGHSDGLLVQAGSGAMTSGVPDSAGVPKGCTQDTLTAEYNNLESVRTLMEANKDQVAAIIVEPVAANMGVVAPEPGFLEGLRSICDENNSLLIFDEVITGFRLKVSGAQGYYGVQADLVTFGKIIGAGMPVGAYGGRKEIMEVVSPVGAVYQAGTLSGNPVAMTAGFTQLQILKNHPEYYDALNKKADAFYEALASIVKKHGHPYVLNHVGSLGSLFFTEEPVRNYVDAKRSDTQAFAGYCNHMLNHGIFLAPSQFEAMFLSMVHTEEQLECTLSLAETYFSKIL